MGISFRVHHLNSQCAQESATGKGYFLFGFFFLIFGEGNCYLESIRVLH